MYSESLGVDETYNNVGDFLNHTFGLAEFGSKDFIVYAHYAGAFDFLYLLDFLKVSPEYKLKSILEIGGNVLQLKIQKGRKIIEFRDSWALFHASLDKVGSSLVGESKTHKEMDKSRLEDYPLLEVIEYCMDDCILLYKSLEAFEQEVGELQITTALQCLTYFKENYLDYEFKTLQENQYNEFKSWFYGGHVDVFKRYASPCYEYDIVSCYGSAMANFGSILGNPVYVEKPTKQGKGLYAITTNAALYAPTLARKINQRLYFCNSDSIYFCTSIDLQLLEELGISFRILYGYEFDFQHDFFKPYVENWHEKKSHSPKMKFIAKLFINGLFGKFGQRIERLSTAIGDNLAYYYDTDLMIGREFTKKINWFNQPQISAWVTSGARYIHSKALQKYQDHAAYCDTDSLFLNKPMSENDLTNSGELGKFELEGKHKCGYFLGNKFYGISNDQGFYSKLKGFNQQFSENDFQNALNGKFEFSWNSIRMQKMKSALLSTGNFVAYKELEKFVKEANLKRKLLADSINTIPFFYSNGKLT